jgi:hypothetical protein
LPIEKRRKKGVTTLVKGRVPWLAKRGKTTTIPSPSDQTKKPATGGQTPSANGRYRPLFLVVQLAMGN